MVSATWRAIRAVTAFLPLAIAFLRDRKKYLLFGPKRKTSPETRRRRAEKLRVTLEKLGPTYIKVGQILSTRPDVLPREYMEELRKLQDDVPPARYNEIHDIIKEDIGEPTVIFDAFNEEALSGASLGQVHIAYFRGEKVAVKIRRPGVEKLVQADLKVMRFFLPFAKKLVEQAHKESMQGLADSFEQRIQQEMSYVRERRMLEEIAANFEDDDRVLMPKTYGEVSTNRVLTMSYEPGIKITDKRLLRRKGFDTSRIAKDLEKIYLEMTLVDGVFHGDPHPGNLAVNDRGQIVIYDFGMSGRITPSLQQSFIDLYVSASQRNPDGVIDAMIDMGTLSRDVERDVMRDVIEIAIKDLSGELVDDFRIQKLMDQIEETVYEYPFRIPSYVALGLRVSTIVEGVCLELDEDFDFIAVAREFLIEQGYIQEQIRNRMVDAWDDLMDTFVSIARTPSKFETSLDKIGRDDVELSVDVEDSKKHIEKLGKRMSISIISGSAIMAGSILTLTYPVMGAAMFIAALLSIYLLRRTYRDKKLMGPKHTATRYQAEKMEEEAMIDGHGYTGDFGQRDRTEKASTKR